MRFYNYMNEKFELRNIPSKKMEQFMYDCLPVFKDIKKSREFLYSGRKSNDDLMKKKIRKNRKPSDVSIDFHKVFDDAFQKKFGVKARSNTLFCTKNENTAKGYGTVYYVFPVGSGYTYIWSDDVDDLYSKSVDIIKKWVWSVGGYIDTEAVYRIVDFIDENWTKKKSWRKTDDDIDTNIFNKKSFDKFFYSQVDKIIGEYKESNKITKLHNSNEIMLNCGEIYLINSRKIPEQEMLQWIDQMIK